jgi:hypothetical protein
MTSRRKEDNRPVPDPYSALAREQQTYTAEFAALETELEFEEYIAVAGQADREAQVENTFVEAEEVVRAEDT